MDESAVDAPHENDEGMMAAAMAPRLPPVAEARSVAAALRVENRLLAALAVFSVLINALMLTGPMFMLQVYNLVLPAASTETLLVLGLLVVLLFLAYGLLELVRGRLQARLAARIVQRLRRPLFAAMARLSLNSGGAPAAMQPARDLEVINNYYGGPAFLFWFDAPTAPLYFAVIFLMHPWLGVYAVAALALLLLMALFFHKRAQRPLQDVQRAQAGQHGVLDATRLNASAVAAMGMTSSVARLFDTAHDGAIIATTRARDRTGTLSSVTRALRLLLQSGMLALGALLVIRNEIHAGAMIIASIILARALFPVDQFIAHLQLRGNLRQARTRIDKWLAALPPNKRPTPLPPPRGVLEVKALAVHVPNGKLPVLHGVSFTARPGRIVVVAGPVGVGKSSLLRALVGAWPVREQAGSVKLDGASFDQWSDEDRGRFIGYLPQEARLFDDTIRANITRFRPDATAEQLWEAARRAGAERLIRDLGGYDAPVGPNGERLSTGQRRRIALAQALFGNPELIVLDEPETGLDDDGMAALLKVLSELREAGRTIILSSHAAKLHDIADDLLLLDYDQRRRGRQLMFGPRQRVLRELAARRKKTAPAPRVGAGRMVGKMKIVTDQPPRQRGND